MLLVQQRNPTDEMNEQRPQASFQKNLLKRRHFLLKLAKESTRKQMRHSESIKACKKIPQDVIEGTQILSIFFLGQNL